MATIGDFIEWLRMTQDPNAPIGWKAAENLWEDFVAAEEEEEGVR